MKILKKITTILAVGVFSATLTATLVSAQTYNDYVSCNKKQTQTHQTGGLMLENYYDCGSNIPFDNVELKAYSKMDSANYHVYATIHYRDYVGANAGTVGGFTTITDECKGSERAAQKQYTPTGVDFLQPTSYAESSYGYQNDFLNGTQNKIDVCRLTVTY